MKRNVLYFIILLCITKYSIVAQPAYQNAHLIESNQYLELKEDFISWFSYQDPSDSKIIKEGKKFSRFELEWSNRVVYSEEINGSFVEYSKASLAEWSSPRCNTSDESKWEPVGPFPMGRQVMGMINAIWMDKNDPSFIIAGSGRNGSIFRSLNQGQSWEEVLTTQKIPALGINHFAVSPNKINNKRVIYAATGGKSFSIGIIKSIDNGQTWQILDDFPEYDNANPNLNPFYKVNKVIVPQNLNAQQSDIVYAISKNQFYRSLDAGATWSKSNFSTDIGEIIDMEISKSNYNSIFISTNCISHYDGSIHTNVFDHKARLFHSSDGGISWTDITSNIGNDDYSSIRIDITENGDLYVHYSVWGGSIQIHKSTDNGNTFSFVSNGVALYGNNAFQVSSNTSNIYEGNVYFYRNSNSLQGFTSQLYSTTHADVRTIQLIENSQNDILILGNDGGISISQDNGNTWSSLNGYGENGLNNNELHGFDVSHNNSDRVVVGRQDNGTTVMINGLWTNKHLLYGDGEKVAFKPDDDSYFYSINNCEIFKYNLNNWSQDYSFNSDPGVNCYNYNNTDKYLGRPFAVNRSYPNKIYAGKLRGKITMSNDDGVNWTEVILKDPDGNNVSAKVIDIEISESSPNIMYALTSRVLWKSPAEEVPHSAVFRSEDYGQNWEDITRGVNTNIPNSWKNATDLTISSQDPNKIWVSMGSVCKNAQGIAFDRVFMCDNADQDVSSRDWIDLTTDNLSPLPVMAIVNQPGTDRVFIGTDAGVFYYDNEDWQCFSKDLPITWIVEMKIVEETGELYVGTYGNGLWKSPLPCIENTQTTLIDQESGDIVWDYDKNIGGDIFITDNKTLKITNSAVISMGSNKKIIVQAGARLIVDNATITSGCGDYWKGIQVWGDRTKNQSYNAQTGLPNFQGEVIIKNGGSIRNAIDAVSAIKINDNGTYDWNKTGGIIKLRNAKLVNNYKGVWLGAYQDPNNNFFPNRSYVINSEFITDNNLLPSRIPYSFVGLYKVSDIIISGNTFENRNTNLDHTERGNGVFVYSASARITDLCTSGDIPCSTYKPNKFKGLVYGVYASFSNDKVVKITNNEFEDVYHSIYLNNSKNAVVTENVIEVGDNTSKYINFLGGHPYGIYISGGTGFKVEENEISAFNNFDKTLGIIVNNTGPHSNEVYYNTLSDLNVGALAQYSNKSIISSQKKLGLKFFCNIMNNPKWDFYVGGKTYMPGVLGIGIARAQGISDGTGYLPAGNDFSTINLSGEYQFDNSDAEYINYYYDNTSTVNYNSFPQYRSSNVSDEAVYEETQCPSKLSGNGISTLYSNYHSARVAYNSSNLILEIWRDGGNANLDQEVETIQPWDVYVEFNSLMGESPYLSEDVLIAVIENDAFTSLMVKLLMIANPHGIRSDAVMNALYERNPPLPESYIQDILAAEGTDSQLEFLENDVAMDYHLVRNIGEDIKRVYRTDTINSWAIDSLIDFVSRQNNLFDKYELATIYLNQGLYEDMNTLLSAIPQNFELSEQQATDYSSFIDVFDIAESMYSQGLIMDCLDSEQIATLEGALSLKRPLLSAMALSLLKDNDSEYDFHEEILFPEEEIPSMANPNNQHSEADIEEAEYQIRFYPNPANDYITLEYNTGELEYSELVLEIFDIQGKLVLSKKLQGRSNDILVDLSKLKSGMYYVKVRADSKVLEENKLNIL